VTPYIYATVLTQAGGSIPPYFDFLQEVSVCADGYQCKTPVSDATVTVNGAPLEYDSTGGAYFGVYRVAEGSVVTVQVTIGTNVYTASGTQFTTPPTVTAPDAGDLWLASNANNITWTGGTPTDGANYFAQVSTFDSNGFHQVFPATPQSGEIPITSTSATIPSGTLPTGTDFAVLVGIVSAGATLQNAGGIAIPDAGTGSGLWFGILAPTVGVSTQ